MKEAAGVAAGALSSVLANPLEFVMIQQQIKGGGLVATAGCHLLALAAQHASVPLVACTAMLAQAAARLGGSGLHRPGRQQSSERALSRPLCTLSTTHLYRSRWAHLPLLSFH